MFSSFEIGTFLGIKVRMHFTFVALILFLMIGNSAPPLVTLAGVTVLFGVVFLHELGHSLMARHFGIRVLDITFWPLGGMARMSEIPEDSKVEGLIAIAGPAVNFALAFLAAPVFFWSQMESGSGSQWVGFVEVASYYFLVVNLMLGGFNLLPAFPMDGGRVLRAFLGRKGDWLGATERAVKVGKFFALLMVVAPFHPRVNVGMILPLIGVFIWFAGSRELMGVRLRHARMAGGFAGPGSGMGGLRDLFEAARRAQAQAADAREPTIDIDPLQDPHAAQRPDDARDLGPGDAGGSRVTDEEIERLESFRGRLRRFDRDV